MDVPPSIEYGSRNDVVLDCDFDSDGEQGVEVKWFIDGLVDQIYQWVPETNSSAKALGKLKDVVDVTYRASNDKKTMHRALHIVNITKELSGNYSCKVSGLNTEAVATKRMVIYGRLMNILVKV